jgi:hypothetical protein
LAEQAEEAARQLERLSRERNRPDLAQAAQQMRQAADAMRRAASSGDPVRRPGQPRWARLSEAQRRLEQEQGGRARHERAAAGRRDRASTASVAGSDVAPQSNTTGAPTIARGDWSADTESKEGERAEK